MEAANLGRGGLCYMADLSGLDPKTIRQGRRDLELADDPADGRVRKKGGGRVRILAVTPAIEQQFLTVISEHTAGCLQQRLRWTNLKQQEIADAMSELADGNVSRYLVRQVLKQHGFVKR